MNRGTTTPLPPYPTTRGDDYPAEYHDIIDIIDGIWGKIAKIEKQLRKKPNMSLSRQLEYYYNLSDYWEEVYLCLLGRRFYEGFL